MTALQPLPTWAVATAPATEPVTVAEARKHCNVVAVGSSSLTIWVRLTVYAQGLIRGPTTSNGYGYAVLIAGTSGATEPTWPTTIGATVVDGTVTWICIESVSDDDALLTALIVAARELVERDCSRSLITQTLRARLTDFPEDEYLDLPRPPLASVTSIKYYDTDGVEQTLSSAAYTVDTDREPGRVWLNNDYTWPETDGRPNAVTILYVSGAASAAVPQRAKQAILLLVAHWYRCREAVGRVEEPVRLAYDSLLSSLRVGAYP